MLEALGVTALAFALDYVWVWYTKAVADHRTVPATIWSGTIMLITGINIVAISQHWHLVICAAVGAAMGTYAAMRQHPDGR